MEKFRLLAFVLLLTGCLSGEKISTIPFGISSGSDGGSGNSPISPKGGFCKLPDFFGLVQQDVALEGTYGQVYIDDFVDNQPRLVHFIESDKGEKTFIQETEELKRYNVGDKLKIEGSSIPQNSNNQALLDYQLVINGYVPTVQPQKIYLKNSASSKLRDFNLKLLVVLVNYNDRTTTDTYTLQNAKEDMIKFRDFYKDASNGQIDFDIDVDEDGEPDAEVITATENFGCGLETFRRVARTYTKDHNYADYTNVAIVTSMTTNAIQNQQQCGYGGVAYVANGPGISHIASPQALTVLIHEVGHNLGLGHSNRAGVEYADHSDPMGNDFSDNPVHFNGVKMVQLGILDSNPRLAGLNSTPGYYMLSSSGSNNNTNYLKLISTRAGNTTYYMTNRTLTGWDSKMDQSRYCRSNNPNTKYCFTGVNIYTGGTGQGGTSVIQATLEKPGDNYTANGMTVNLLSQEGENAEISISVNGDEGAGKTCTRADPTADFIELTTENDLDKLAELVVNFNNVDNYVCEDVTFDLKVESSQVELVEDVSVTVKNDKPTPLAISLKKLGDLKPGEVVTGTLIATDPDGNHAEKRYPFSLELTKSESRCKDQ
ncbi:MAG: hypothetical protein H6621_06870 [Halobacteriovoraceae bacterium]|nr:hypothetical protein [Halobacteriovoraceae bacterium]